ncbi:MAG TPA: WD40 repeat domain-containing protein, partial [Fimbriimonadaceae bacterium]|nr:WD40 repeat domain-containing protein [Fimbriimonadaceae bacterium]
MTLEGRDHAIEDGDLIHIWNKSGPPVLSVIEGHALRYGVGLSPFRQARSGVTSVGTTLFATMIATPLLLLFATPSVRVADGWMPTAAPWAYDGRHIVAAVSVADGGAVSKDIRVWDVKSGSMVRDFKPSDGGYSVMLSPDGRYVLSMGSVSGETGAPTRTSATRLYDVATGREILRVPTDFRYQAAAFSRDGKRLLLAGGGYPAQVFDLPSGKLRLSVEVAYPENAVLSPTGDWLLVADLHGGARHGEPAQVWDVSTTKVDRSVDLWQRDCYLNG